tara:strand:- start:74 stop:412 length:339 start_codon:yes stop_codon:yes gene_type:complete
MRWVKYLCVFYILIIVAGFGTLFFLDSQQVESGCFLYDSLVIGAKCQGFYGAKFFEVLMGLPLSMLYLPIFGIYAVFDRPSHIESYYLFCLGFAIWLPIIYLLKYGRSRNDT